MAAGETRNRWPEYFSISGMNGSAFRLPARRCGEDLVDAPHLDQFADAEPTRMRVPDVGGVHLDSPHLRAPTRSRWTSGDPSTTVAAGRLGDCGLGDCASVGGGSGRVEVSAQREHDGSGDTVKMRLRHALPAGLLDAGFASLARLIIGIYAARALTVSDLGAYALFFSAFVFAIVVPMQFVLVPAELATLPAARHERWR